MMRRYAEAIVALGCAAIIAAAIGSWRCRAAWADSGMRAEWTFGAGCRVETAPGVWVPARNVRDAR